MAINKLVINSSLTDDMVETVNGLVDEVYGHTFDNVESLKNGIDSYGANVDLNLLIGRNVKTLGYHAKGDGGGASYLFKTLAQATADGDVYSATSKGNLQTDAGVFVLQRNGTVNPLKYGLKMDDLTAGVPESNWLSMVSIFNENPDGIEIFCPIGTQNWGGDRVYNLKNFTFRGVRGLSKIKMINDGLLSSIPTTSKIGGTAENLHFYNLVIDNSDFATGSDAMFIWITPTKGFTFQGIDFICGGRPFRLGAAVEGDLADIVVDDCRFKNSSPTTGHTVCDIEDGPRKVRISNNDFEAAASLVAEGNNHLFSINLQIKSGKVFNNTIRGSYYGGILVETGMSEDVDLYNNTIDLTTSQEDVMVGIFMQGAKSCNAWNNTLISDGRPNHTACSIQEQTPIHTTAKFKHNNVKNFGLGVKLSDQGGLLQRLPSAEVEFNTFDGVTSGGVFQCIATSSTVVNSDTVITFTGNKGYNLACGDKYAVQCAISDTVATIDITDNHFEFTGGYIRPEAINVAGGFNKNICQVTLGGNTCNDADIGIYSGTSIRDSISVETGHNVTFLDERVYQSQMVTLSGAAADETIFTDSTAKRFITGIDIAYPTATSSDAGRSVSVWNDGTSGLGNRIAVITTDADQPSFATTRLRTQSLQVGARSTTLDRANITIDYGTAKVGDGTAIFKVKYITNSIKS